MKAKKTLLAVLFSIALSGTFQSYAQVQDEPEDGDHFGESVATGDFNGDGEDDLAIGIPGESISGVEAAGAVCVLYGSSTGLTSTNQFLHQNQPNVGGTCQVGDGFGYSLAVGDFDNDGFDDLAIGVPFKDVNSKDEAGAVNVLYGSPFGLASGDKMWHQNKSGVDSEPGVDDHFGSSLASGDFDGDGFDDLAIGVPRETIKSVGAAGAVYILHGSSAGLTTTGDQFWHQNKLDVKGKCEELDVFGSSLASGDFDGDGFDDLAIGVQLEDIKNDEGTHVDAGGVNVLYGSSGVGLTATGNQFKDQGLSYNDDVLGGAEGLDWFGYSLVSGDFDGDGFDDLAIGVYRETIEGVNEAGAVNVLYGSAGVGLTSTGNQLWYQGSGVLDDLEPFDFFGSSLASGDFDSDGYDDLAIGVESETVNSGTNAGAVNVLYGTVTGLLTTGGQFWHQDILEGVPELDDEFGHSLAAGDFDGDGFDDLAIGVDQETIGSGEEAANEAGAVNVLYGTVTGLNATDEQICYQGIFIRLAGDEWVNSSFSVYPNPAGSQTLLHFSLEQRLQVSIKVFDVNGKEIQSVLNDILDQGDHTLPLNTSGFPKGVYMVQLITNGGIENQKLMVQ